MTRADDAWPKISLVTPVFNSAGYLDATIRSVLSQNYPNLEYVIVDGGSTDSTLSLARQHRHLTVLERPGSGRYAQERAAASGASQWYAGE